MTNGTVGVVGLGLMGGSIAERLLGEGLSVVGHDVREERTDALIELGGEVADSPAAVAARVDVVLTSLPTPDAVEEVYLGEEGIAAGATGRPTGSGTDEGSGGLVAVEMSTIDPDTTRRVARSLSGVDLLDAPVSGGPEDCREGTLKVIAGGEAGTLERPFVRAVLDALGDEVYHTGEVGTGHTVKLLNNLMSMGNLLLAMETVALGAAAGVDGEVMLDVLTNTGGASNQLRKRLPRVLNRNFEPGFTVDYAKKDLGLALETAAERDVPMALGALVHQLYVRASAEGLGEEDACSTVRLFEGSTDATAEADREVDETFSGYGE